MEGGCEQHPGTERPQESSFEVERAPHRPPDHQDDPDGGEPSCPDRVSGRDLEEAEGALHEPPVFAVGRQAGKESATCVQVGEVRDQHDAPECDERRDARASYESGQGGDRRDLGQRGEPQRCSRPGSPSPSDGVDGGEDGECEPEEPERLEVSVAGDLDDQQWGPGVEKEAERRPSARHASDTHDDEGGREITPDPHGFHRDDVPREWEVRAHDRDHVKDVLSHGRIDRRHRRIVDQVVPRRRQVSDLERPGGKEVRIHASPLHVSVPEVPPKVVGQRWLGGEHDHSQDDRDRPDPWQEAFVRVPKGDDPGGQRVRAEGGEVERQPRQREVAPARSPHDERERGELDTTHHEQRRLRGAHES